MSEKMVQITIMIPETELEDLKKVAKAEERSMAAQARYLIRNGLSRNAPR